MCRSSCRKFFRFTVFVWGFCVERLWGAHVECRMSLLGGVVPNRLSTLLLLEIGFAKFEEFGILKGILKVLNCYLGAC